MGVRVVVMEPGGPVNVGSIARAMAKDPPNATVVEELANQDMVRNKVGRDEDRSPFRCRGVLVAPE